jgi:hypothetical protein
MANQDTPLLVPLATDAGDRMKALRHQPTVLKAAEEAGADIAPAGNSMTPHFERPAPGGNARLADCRLSLLRNSTPTTLQTPPNAGRLPDPGGES